MAQITLRRLVPERLAKINSLDELKKLRLPDELLTIHFADMPEQSFTSHGTFLGTDGLKLELTDELSLPIAVRVNTRYPNDLLQFLRELNDPKYTRTSRTEYWLRDFPGLSWEIYKVERS